MNNGKEGQSVELERETEIILPATVKLYVSRTTYPDEVIRVQREEFRKPPRELVRCKDCRFRVLHQCNCEKKENVTYGMFTEDDFFCANGERKE